MEIQKVFSDYYDTERLYSVRISEPELALYSEILEQREYVSVRKAKKQAKSALALEQEFRDAVENKTMTAEEANERYAKEMNKLMGRKNAHKVLNFDRENAVVTINPIKSDRAAEQIAGAIGNGNQEVKAQIADALKRSKGGKGVNVQQHIAQGLWDPKGVRQGVTETAKRKAVNRSRENGLRKQNNDLRYQLMNNQQMAEAKQRSMQAKYNHELERLQGMQLPPKNPSYQHQNSYLDIKSKKRLAREQAEKEAMEQAVRDAANKAAKEQAVRDAANKAAKETSRKYLKRGGLILGAAGLAYGGKKIYDKYYRD